MTYLCITAVPVSRETNPVRAPAADLAARMPAGQEVVELRLHRQDGRTWCYLGFETPVRMKQAALLLKASGYLYEELDPPQTDETNILLYRAVERRVVVKPGGAPVQMLLPSAIEEEPARTGTIFRTLADMADGCGLAFFFRRAGMLPLNIVSHLHGLDPVEGSLCHQLLHCTRMYEAVGCVYGSDADLAMLASEATYSWPGLTTQFIPSSPVNRGLFSCLMKHVTVSPVLRPLSCTYLESELDVLADLSGSAGIYGLPLNKDTIFGIPHPVEKEKEKCIRLGFSASGEPVEIPLKRLRQHMFIGGPPGSGKGNEYFSLAAQLHEAGVPMLLIESAKQEMHHLRKVIPGLQVWQPQGGEYVLNPFALEGDITCGEMRTSLLQVLRLCFKLDGPLEELFSDTLNRCFARNGFTDDSTASSTGVTPFGLSEFMEEYVQLLNEKGYSQRTKDDMKTAGLVRLNTLFNQNRAVFDTVHSIPVRELLRGENLIQLNCLPTPEAKQMFASMLLIYISAWLRLRGTHCVDRPVKLAIILDESHNLLQPAVDSQGRSYSFSRDFANMLLELRSQGVAILLADQSSDNIPREITDVCATKVFFGGSVSSGICSNLAYMGADETALDNLYLMGPGEGCFVTHGMPRAAFFSCPNVIDLFHLEQPYLRANQYLKNHPRLTLESFRECGSCPARGRCVHADKTTARQTAAVLYQKYGYLLGELMDQELTKVTEDRISGTMVKVFSDVYTQCSSTQRYCAMVQFVRDFNRENPGILKLRNVLTNAEKIWTALDKKK